MKKQDIQKVEFDFIEGSELPHRVEITGRNGGPLYGAGVTLGAALVAAVRLLEDDRLPGLVGGDPWQRIDPADPSTLPNDARNIDISYTVRGLSEPHTFVAFYTNAGWHYIETGKPLAADMLVYSWKDRPLPAPYHGGD
jgi:hypothetical protein